MGRRVDIAITTPKGEYWIDVAAVHSTAASYVHATKAWFQKEAVAESIAAEVGTENAMSTQNSPTVAATVKKKFATYSLMTSIAALQKAKRVRDFVPRFMACVVSHEGEMSSDVFAIIEELAKCVRVNALTDTSCGYPPAQVSAEFRRRAKDRIATAVAAGFGRALSTVGYPSPATVEVS